MQQLSVTWNARNIEDELSEERGTSLPTPASDKKQERTWNRNHLFLLLCGCVTMSLQNSCPCNTSTKVGWAWETTRLLQHQLRCFQILHWYVQQLMSYTLPSQMTSQDNDSFFRVVECCSSYTKGWRLQKHLLRLYKSCWSKENPDNQMDHHLLGHMLFSELAGSCSLHCTRCNLNYTLQKVCLAINCAGLEYQNDSFKQSTRWALSTLVMV